MKKDQYEDSNLHLKRKMNEEVLEISSTGYGLESVSLETAKEQNFQGSNNSNPAGCGEL